MYYGWPHSGNHVYGKNYRQEATFIAPQDLRSSIRPFVEWWFRLSNAGYLNAVDYADESKYLTNSESAYVIRPLWLAKLVGNRQFLELMKEAELTGLSVDETIENIENTWIEELNSYKNMRNKYQLYPD